jgi:hypothetical protein
VPHVNLQPGSPLQQRSTAELTTWRFAFPIVGGVILGMLIRYAVQQRATLTAGQWVSIAFAMALGLFAIVMPPIIASRELKRRRLEQEDESEYGPLKDSDDEA